MHGPCMHRPRRRRFVFGEFWYAADTWSHERRVIAKAEVMSEGETRALWSPTRTDSAPESLYRHYCQRGDPENRIKELKEGPAGRSTILPRLLGQPVSPAFVRDRLCAVSDHASVSRWNRVGHRPGEHAASASAQSGSAGAPEREKSTGAVAYELPMVLPVAQAGSRGTHLSILPQSLSPHSTLGLSCGERT